MNSEPGTIETRSAGMDQFDDAEMVAGQAEVVQFECARAAYNPTNPAAVETLLAAFRRFHRLGYEAYFGGATVMPAILATQDLTAGMWMIGYRAAETEALTMRCSCDCSRKYVWGKGYGPCARRANALRASICTSNH